MLLRTIVTVPLAICAVVCSTGCATSEKKKPATPAARQPAFVGTISLVNSESQFVLIDNGLLPTPPAGLVLKSYTNGTESAELITSPARRRPFTIADIRHGLPQKGDRVFVATLTELRAEPVAQQEPGAPIAPGVPPELPEFLPPAQLSPAP